MAREHARILTSIWSDADFRERTPEAQRLYVLVLSQKGVNNAGVAPLLLKKWARASVHTEVHDLEKPLQELDEHRYLIVDEDSDEVLVRSFIRNDGVWRQPNVLKNALREARVTESPRLRSVLAEELRRIASWLPTGKGYEGIPEMLRTTVRQLDPNPSPDGSDEGLSDPSTGPSDNTSVGPEADPSPNPSRSRGVGEGVGEGGLSRPVGRSLGGSRASVREAPTPSASGGPPTPSSRRSNDATTSSTPGSMPGFTEQPCGRRHSPDQPCRRCGEARQAQVTDGDRARREQAAAVHGCGMCDGDGRLLEVGRFLPVSPTASCDHETDHRQQVADARNETS